MTRVTQPHRTLSRIGLLSLFVVSSVLTAIAQVPQTINFQGYLTNVTGAPISGSRAMTFRLYTGASGGTAVWTETQTVTVTNGVYNVRLGSVTPITLTTPTQYYLGVKVGADLEMTPRTALTSVMSALMLRDVTIKDSNTFLGYRAGFNNTTGLSNTFVGHRAGESNSTGGFNTILGFEAGATNTTGYANTFVGAQAGSQTTGGYNAFVGMSAGGANTTGDHNTFVGAQVGCNNTSGSYNVFVGFHAGDANATMSNNTFIGAGAGFANTGGDANTFLGTGAGTVNTIGGHNTFLGFSAGQANTEGWANTFLGFEAGGSNTTGYTNTFLGWGAGYTNITGIGNVFLGYQAGRYATGSNKLYIDNSDTTTPLVYGEFDTDLVRINGNLEVTGTAAKPGGGSWAVYSDQQLKDAQGPFTRGLDALNQLRPVVYRYKADNPLNLPLNTSYIGLIAQEVQPAIPEAVSTGQDGYLTVNNDPILWTMLNAIKELQADNQALRQEVEALKARLNQ